MLAANGPMVTLPSDEITICMYMNRRRCAHGSTAQQISASCLYYDGCLFERSHRAVATDSAAHIIHSDVSGPLDGSFRALLSAGRLSLSLR